MTPDPPHQPHVLHAHAPHIHEPPAPDVAYVHPSVLEDEERRDAERRKLAHEHRVWGLVLFLIAFFPSAYCNYRIVERIGWWTILPPVFIVLFFGPSLVLLAELIVVTVFGGIAKIIFPARSKPMNEWLDAAWEVFPKKGAVIGGLVGVVVYFISGFLA